MYRRVAASTLRCLAGNRGGCRRADTWDWPVVRVGELTTLLQFADESTVFHFLHVPTNRLSQANAVSYYRLAPEVHDHQKRGTLLRLSGDAVRVEE